MHEHASIRVMSSIGRPDRPASPTAMNTSSATSARSALPLPSRGRLLVAALLGLLICQPSLAQTLRLTDKAAKPLSQSELMLCLQRQDALAERDASLGQRHQALEQQTSALEAQRAALGQNRPRTAAETDPANQAQRQQQIHDYNQQLETLKAAQAEFNSAADQFGADQQRYASDCSGRPFKPADEQAARAKLDQAALDKTRSWGTPLK
jgi:hypothetical protein